MPASVDELETDIGPTLDHGFCWLPCIQCIDEIKRGCVRWYFNPYRTVWSAIQQLFKWILDDLALYEHASISRWNVRWYLCNYRYVGKLDSSKMEALCLSSESRLCSGTFLTFPGEKCIICDIFKDLWYNIVLRVQGNAALIRSNIKEPVSLSRAPSAFFCFLSSRG